MSAGGATLIPFEFKGYADSCAAPSALRIVPNLILPAFRAFYAKTYVKIC